MSGAHAHPDRIDYCPFSGASIGRHDVPLDPEYFYAILVYSAPGPWPRAGFCHISEHYRAAVVPGRRRRAVIRG